MGSQHQDVIVINGKRYDAVTGQILKEGAPAANETKPVQVQPKSTVQTQKKNGVVLDGFMRSTKAKTPKHNHETAPHVQKLPQKSNTLMRNVVKKPEASKKVAASNTPIQKASIRPSAKLVQSAQSVQKSPMVSHYGDVQHRSSVIKKVAHLPVKAPPIDQHTKQLNTNHNKTDSIVVVAPSRTDALINRALASATSHEQPAHDLPSRKRRRKLAHKLGISGRAMAISTSVLAGVLLGGFFAVQNVPNLSMRVAAARAGFDATMPGYKPSGFSFKGPIEYTNGQVTVSFKSNTDDRSYSVTQRTSNWNSDALLSNFVIAENKQYQTYIDRGRTLYIYDGSNATWIDNGVWYQVEGQSDMTTDQLVRIAASI